MLLMNLHNLPNVIGAQRQLLKALDNADICSDDMLKLSELDPEFGKLSSIVATIYSKVPTVSDTSLKDAVQPVAEDVNEAVIVPVSEETTEAEVKTKTKPVEWVPVTKLRNMYPLAYSFLKHRVDLSVNGKAEIWDIFKKNYPDYNISEDDFYRLMKLVINIRAEKAREIDDRVNAALTTPPAPVPTSDTVIESTVEESESKKTTEITTTAEVAENVEEPNTVKSPLVGEGECKVYPNNENIRLFENGAVQTKTMSGDWHTRTVSNSKGYAVFSYQNRSWPLAKLMLETFKPATFGKKVKPPFYKDGNKMNCKIDNLSWGEHVIRPTETQIHEACQIIKDNPTASERVLLRIMTERKIGVQNTCLRSIMNGEYTFISEKYFTLQNGKPIPIQEEQTKEKPVVIDNVQHPAPTQQSEVDKLVDSINYKRLMLDRNGDLLSYFKGTKNLKMAIKAFEAKMDLKMKIDSSDKIIPVLEFALDKEGNLRNAGEILKDVTKKYGNLYITQNYVKDIINGKIGKEYSDIVFNK